MREPLSTLSGKQSDVKKSRTDAKHTRNYGDKSSVVEIYGFDVSSFFTWFTDIDKILKQFYGTTRENKVIIILNFQELIVYLKLFVL